jgi:hypothetical protein
MFPRFTRVKNKFGARKVKADGHTFDSGKEHKRYQELKLLQASGEIHSLELHPKFKFTIDGRPVLIKSEGYPKGRQASWSADFRYVCNRRKAVIIEDTKGVRTDIYKLKRALCEAMFPGIIIEET